MTHSYRFNNNTTILLLRLIFDITHESWYAIKYRKQNLYSIKPWRIFQRSMPFLYLCRKVVFFCKKFHFIRLHKIIYYSFFFFSKGLMNRLLDVCVCLILSNQNCWTKESRFATRQSSPTNKYTPNIFS